LGEKNKSDFTRGTIEIEKEFEGCKYHFILSLYILNKVSNEFGSAI
jgi:hypothetical protein